MKVLKTLLTGILFTALLCGSAWADVVEDFEDGKMDNWSILSGNWNVVRDTQADGTIGYVLKITGLHSSGNAMTIYNCGEPWPEYNVGQDWTDYTFEADVRMDGGGDFWMAWWTSDLGQNYAQWFPGSLRARWSGGGIWGEIGSYPWYWEYGKWYHMKAVITGSNQKFYIDDNLMFEHNYDAYSTSGTINFRTLSSYMTIDNVVVTGVIGCVTPVDIDIKPGSDPNSININSKGVIPVAALTTGDFYAVDVDADTVRFGPANASPVHSALEDVDGDGDIDLILHFRTQEIGIGAGDTEAVLTGETVDGRKLEGSDSVRILENKGKKK